MQESQSMCTTYGIFVSKTSCFTLQEPPKDLDPWLDSFSSWSPPFDVFNFVTYQKFKGGTLVKFEISMLFNLAETLRSKRKLENKQVAKI